MKSDQSSGDIVHVLASERGLQDVLNGTVPKLSDPRHFPEMGRAVERIDRAVAEGETIGIFGDYDADGITGVAQIVRYFRRHGREPVVHLPHRGKEGYGMRKKSLDELRGKGVTLLITVDTGIAATTEIAHASGLGMDVIVTDHHHAPEGRPPAYAVIHPRIPAEFPNPHLSGSGVALLLVRALERGKRWDGIEQDIILASIGTIGDLVPLVGENRVLVSHALRLLAKLPPCPLKDFADQVRAGSAAALTSTDVAFRIVPRINASGRIDHPDIALKALLEGGDSLSQLHALNTQRQGMTAALCEKALAMIDLVQPFLCVMSEEFHPGIVGLIAGFLTERYGRPSLVAAVNGDTCVASLRSIPEVHVAEYLHAPEVLTHLLTCGGHAQAAGCSFLAGSFAGLQSALCTRMHENGVHLNDLRPTLNLDAEVSLDELTPTFALGLERLEPFGMGNAQPLFFLRGQTVEWMRAVGAEGKHLQCRIGGKKAVGFGLGSLLETLAKSQWWDIACTVGMTEWNGKREVQMIVKDVRAIGTQQG